MNSLKRLSMLTRAAVLLGLVALIAVLSGVSTVSADSDITTPLSLRTRVTIEDSAIRLDDIFDGFGGSRAGINGDTVVAYAPQPGRRAVFDAKWLSRVARRYRLDWRPTTRLDRVIVERASTIITAEDIISAIRDDLKAGGNWENVDLELSNRNLLVHIESNLPATIEVVNISTEERQGRFSAIIAVPAGDPQARRITIAGRIFPVVEVPVPSRALRPGSVIRPDDIKWIRVRADRIHNNIVSDPAEFTGREAIRPLSANRLVRRSDLRIPVTVSKGMLVTMIFRTSSMVLTATGRALEAGSTGDFITVRNTQTKQIVDARILGPNRVQVAALRQLASSKGIIQ